MPQKPNWFCQKIWLLQINLKKKKKKKKKKKWPDGEKRMPFPDSAVQKYHKSVVEI